MTRRSGAAGVLAFVLTVVQGTWVHAQWGYPGGFGDFGWVAGALRRLRETSPGA